MVMFMHIYIKEKRYQERKKLNCSDYERLYRYREETVEFVTTMFEEETQETRGKAVTSKKIDANIFEMCKRSWVPEWCGKRCWSTSYNCI